MWSDTDTDVDLLNCWEVAELIAEMVGKPNLLPMSLGRGDHSFALVLGI